MSASSKRSLVASDSDSDFEITSPVEKKARKAVAPKKKNPVASEDAQKRLAAILLFNRVTLEDMDLEDVVTEFLFLQAAFKALAAAGPVEKVLSPEQIKAFVETQRKMMRIGISKLMTWKTTCKAGTAKFSFMCVVPGGLSVFLATFGLDAKFKKLATFSVQEFDDICDGAPEGKVRYDTLVLTGKEGKGVTVRWNGEENTVTITGTYGL